MRIDATLQGGEKVKRLVSKMTGPQMRQAQAEGLNDTAARLQGAMRQHLLSAFDMPTQWVVGSVWVERATAEKLSATVLPTRRRDTAGTGGKVGVDPQRILQAQEFGGRRADKRSEVALRRAGILPNGYQTAIPQTPYPGSDDGRGNLRGAFLSQLLSYFQAQTEQGFRSNMTARRKAQLQNKQGIGYLGSRKVLKTTMGVRYFVATGKLRDGRSAHFAPGIWASRGLHGADVQPVVLFVRTGTYRPRISMERIAHDAQAQEYLARRTRRRIYLLAESLGIS
ncbi:MAG: hypothetical protein EOO27_04740 [Comamonadaceae bacterium]|nr:MAG: hypothetical protein EOO27_04740 [Comamonadaceae bacterium]